MYYFEPVNINKWNIFEKVKCIGHIESFRATESMNLGDIILLHVGSQNKKYKSGIYAIGTIVKEPYILEKSSQEYDKKLRVDVRIDKMNYTIPYITHEDCKKFINQFRSVHKIEEKHYELIQKIIDDINLNNNEDIISKIEFDVNESQVLGEDKKAFIKIRINQSIFRKRLLKKYSSCCLCNTSNPDFLIASHIKPWACSNNEEKLDIDNGFLFCPNHDALFDSGYISFDDDGNIMLSNHLKEVDSIFMNVNKNMKINLSSKNKKYLEYHRNNIFKR